MLTYAQTRGLAAYKMAHPIVALSAADQLCCSGGGCHALGREGLGSDKLPREQVLNRVRNRALIEPEQSFDRALIEP